MRKSTHNVNDGLYLSRCANGIKLVKEPLNKQHGTFCYSVANIMQLPINFYFTDTESRLKRINEKTAVTCGYLSEHDAVGRSVRDVAKHSSANAIIKNDQDIVRKRNPNIIEEHFIRHDDVDLVAISIKFPWLNRNNKIVGIFGCSILIGYKDAHPLADSLNILMQSGLMNTFHSHFLPGLKIGGTYFSKREVAILSLLIRGKTAKDIGKMLGLSHRTIEHYLDRAKTKAGASTKSELIEKIFEKLK